VKTKAQREITKTPAMEPHPHERVSTAKRICWGSGGLAESLMYTGVNGLIDQIYIIALGYHAGLVSVIRAIPRFLDFLTDPLVGHLSDNTRSRWGRRRPWMMAGLLISAGVAVAIWFPPRVPHAGADTHWLQAAGNQWKGVAFFTLMMIALYTVGYALFTIPYAGMGYELSTDYNERTHLFKWRMIAFTVGCFLAPWLPNLCMWIEGDEWSKLKGATGAHYVGMILGASILATGLLPILFCRERTQAQTEKKLPLMDAMRSVASNRAFWPVLMGNLVAKFGMVITGIFFRYVFYYHVGKGNLREGATYYGMFCNSINIATLALGTVGVAWLADRMGKKPALLCGLGLSAAAYASFGLTLTNAPAAFTSLHLPGNWTIPIQWPCLLTGVFIGVFTNTMPMLLNSMLADVCDADELKTGQRREAFYSGVFVSCDKMALAVGMMFQGALLVWSGYDANLPTQTDATVKMWILMLVITQPLGFLLGFACILFYPLSRQQCREIRKELDARMEGSGGGVA
jgi:GPH family glycoside/pentoside/hexuronide:cation symporter